MVMPLPALSDTPRCGVTTSAADLAAPDAPARSLEAGQEWRACRTAAKVHRPLVSKTPRYGTFKISDFSSCEEALTSYTSTHPDRLPWNVLETGILKGSHRKGCDANDWNRAKSFYRLLVTIAGEDNSDVFAAAKSLDAAIAAGQIIGQDPRKNIHNPVKIYKTFCTCLSANRLAGTRAVDKHFAKVIESAVTADIDKAAKRAAKRALSGAAPEPKRPCVSDFADLRGVHADDEGPVASMVFDQQDPLASAARASDEPFLSSDHQDPLASAASANDTPFMSNDTLSSMLSALGTGIW